MGRDLALQTTIDLTYIIHLRSGVYRGAAVLLPPEIPGGERARPPRNLSPAGSESTPLENNIGSPLKVQIK